MNIISEMDDKRLKNDKKEKLRKDKPRWERPKKRKGFTGKRKAEKPATPQDTAEQESNVDDASVVVTSDQPGPSCSSLPAPVFSSPPVISVMQSKQGEDLSVTPIKRKLTRKRKRESIIFSTKEVTVASGNKIIDSPILQELLHQVGACPSCHLGNLQLRQDNSKIKMRL